MATKPERKRPGMPRKQDELDRITIRIDTDLALEMNKACDRLDLTQRDFIERAVLLYDKSPVAPPPDGEPTQNLYRTGMWISPKVLRVLDAREVKEGVTQRELLERAIRFKLQHERE